MNRVQISGFESKCLIDTTLRVAWSKCPNANVLNLTRGVCCERVGPGAGGGVGMKGKGEQARKGSIE